MRKHHASPGCSTYLNIMNVMAYINGAAQACPIYINHNGIMLNRSLGFFWRGLSLMRTAAVPRVPPGSSSPVRWVSAVPIVLARPHPPALSVLRRASCFVGTVPLFQPPCPTLFRSSVRGLSVGLSPPGIRRRVCRRVCRHRGAVGDPFVFARPSPPSPGVVSACLAFRRYRSRSPIRARPPYSCFRSVGFRRPQAAVEDSDRSAKQVCAPPGIAERVCCAFVPVSPIRRACPSDRSIDNTSLFSRRAQAPAPPSG